MTAPTKPTDNKNAALLQKDEQEAPPSYSETSGSTIVIGDGNAFSDIPRPGMTYGPGRSEAYVPRAERKGTWSFGFFNCLSDPGAAAKACCCPCVSYGQTRHRLHAPGTEPPIFSTPCLGYCLTASFLPGAESIFGLLQRSELRQRLGIDQGPQESRIRLPGGRGTVRASGSSGTMFENLHAATGFLDDAWRHFFCGCCALTQEDREVRLWEKEWEEGGLENLEGGIEEEGERLLGTERTTLQG
jgi:Cys-rich protein (TIGR01571 family)